MLSRRRFLCGLLAAPVVMQASSLMPLRGVKWDPIVRIQSWPIGEEACGPYWVHEGPLSKIARIETAMREEMGAVFYHGNIGEPEPWERGPALPLRGGSVIMGTLKYNGINASRIGVAHGVSRVDPPVIPLEEVKRRLSRIASYRIGTVNLDSPRADKQIKFLDDYSDRYIQWHNARVDALTKRLDATLAGECEYDLVKEDRIVFTDSGAYLSEPQAT